MAFEKLRTIVITAIPKLDPAKGSTRLPKPPQHQVVTLQSRGDLVLGRSDNEASSVLLRYVRRPRQYIFTAPEWPLGCEQAGERRGLHVDRDGTSLAECIGDLHSSRRIPGEKCVRFTCQESGAHSFGHLPAIPRE